MDGVYVLLVVLRINVNVEDIVELWVSVVVPLNDFVIREVTVCVVEPVDVFEAIPDDDTVDVIWDEGEL